jgi:hypothetical protein
MSHVRLSSQSMAVGDFVTVVERESVCIYVCVREIKRNYRGGGDVSNFCLLGEKRRRGSACLDKSRSHPYDISDQAPER